MDIRYFEVGFTVIMLLVITLMNWLMPALTRRDLLFGVTVAPNARESAAGRGIIARYRLSLIVIDLLVLVAVAVLLWLAPASWWQSGLFAFLIIASTALLALPYLIAHSASRALAIEGQSATEYTAQPIAAPTAELRPRRYGDYVPLIWELLPIGLIGATVAYLATQYASAPNIIATHFDAAGNVNAYTTKSIGSFFLLVWFQLFIYVFLTVISLLTVGAKALSGRADARFRRTWLRVLFGVKVYVIALMGFLAVVIAQAAGQTHFTANWLLPITLGSTLLLILILVVISVRTGQGGSRLEAGVATDRLEDRYWKLGVFYVNPTDSSVFVERRYGIGWTINFGSARAILIFVAILALPIAFAIVSIILAGTH